MDFSKFLSASSKSEISDMINYLAGMEIWRVHAAWKVSKYGVASGQYFPVLELEIFVFSPNTGKYGTEITPYLNTFHEVSCFTVFSILLVFLLFFFILFSSYHLLLFPFINSSLPPALQFQANLASKNAELTVFLKPYSNPWFFNLMPTTWLWVFYAVLMFKKGRRAKISIYIEYIEYSTYIDKFTKNNLNKLPKNIKIS